MEKVFLIGLHLKNQEKNLSESKRSLEELARLVETAGGEVAGFSIQSLVSFNPATLIGRGKVKELAARAQQREFTTLLFDEELKPAQQKNLTELIPAKILDRTRLILDIFAKRAKTKEGILQVELAQISYLLPRITERYGRFEQQVGGIGTRGPGERKLEVEARHIRDRMVDLRREIESIKLHREVARERRHSVPLPVIAIVGYTNAGKSTLLNKLVEQFGEVNEPIYADDKLFATLDPTTRRIKLPSGRWALFTDTVGFIRKLPTHLVAAFRSTLEETLRADLLIHLMDASDPHREQQFETVIDILKSLEPEKWSFLNKMLLVYNKMDLLELEEKAKMTRENSEALRISASLGAGLPELLQIIDQKLSQKMMETDLYLSFKNMRLLPSLYQLGKVENVTHKARGIQLHMKLEKSHWEKLQKLFKKNHDAGE